MIASRLPPHLTLRHISLVTLHMATTAQRRTQHEPFSESDICKFLKGQEVSAPMVSVHLLLLLLYTAPRFITEVNFAQSNFESQPRKETH